MELDADHYQVDLAGFPAHRLLNVVHTWIKRRMKDEDREMFDTMLNEPLPFEKGSPKAVTAPTQSDLQADAQSFLNAQKTLGG